VGTEHLVQHAGPVQDQLLMKLRII